VRDFEDYCWRDLVTEEMRLIYSAYVRERKVGERPALIVLHPGNAAVEAAWQQGASRLLGEARRRGLPVIHSVAPGQRAVEALCGNGEALCPRPCESAFFSSDLERRAARHRGGGQVVRLPGNAGGGGGRRRLGVPPQDGAL
jgi:hypothetical protein